MAVASDPGTQSGPPPNVPEGSSTLVVFDLASLRYRFSSSSLQTLAATGETLSLIDLPSQWDRRTAAFQGCEQALDRGFVRRDGRRCRVALYNPLSGQIALGRVPDTEVFALNRPIAVPESGLVAVRSGDLLLAGDLVIPKIEVTFASLTRSLVAHG